MCPWRGLAVPLLALASCAPLVQYTDEIVDAGTGRTLLVTVPATIGGFCGFVLGIPADLVALPATFAVYRLQDPATADPVSTMLFPSFALWRAGALVAAPVDLLDYGLFRAWQPAPTMNREEREELEYQLDLDTLPVYPVRSVYGETPAGAVQANEDRRDGP